MSYSKLCDTFRAADCTAVRTRLGSPSLIDFNVTRPVPAGFIFEHVPQHRPTCIENGFSHPGLGKLCGADIADNDKLVFASYLSARFVELILAHIRNLGMDCLDAALVTRALCDGQHSLILAVVLQGRNSVTVAARCKCLQPEINPDLPVAGWQIVGNLALETDVPTITRILSKASGLNGVGNIPRFPKVEFTFAVDNVRAIQFHSALDKREPTERPLRATAGAKSRGMARSIARDHELLAYLTDRIGVQFESSRVSCGNLDKIKMRRPSFLKPGRNVSTLDAALNADTMVPYGIHRTRVPVEILPDRRVLDSVLESQNHAGYLLGLRRDFKWTSQNIVGVDIPSLNWSVILYLLQSIVENSSTIRQSLGLKATSERSARQWLACLSPAMVRKITSTCLLNIHPSTLSLFWLMPLKEHRRGCSDLSAGILLLAIGAVFFGPPPILLPVLVALRLRGSSDTWKLNGFPPRRERRGFHPRSR